MLVQPKAATRRSSHPGPRLTQGFALHTLFAVGFTLLVLTCNVYAVQTTLTWSDPNNNPANVGGYHLYYWQGTTPTPPSTASMRDVGKQTTYTLTGLAAGQTYSFAATAYNSTGESTDSNVVNQTFPADAPVAHFSATPGTGTVPLNVTFTSTSTGTITSWAWTFGDGGTSTATSPSHTYTAVGPYTVQLTVTGPSGMDTTTAPVTVSPTPGASLVAAYGFNEGSGTTTADASGNGYAGTFQNGAGWTTGHYGTGLALNGVNAFVSVAASLDLPTLPITLEAWVKPTDYGSYRTLFSKRTSYASTAMRFDWLLDAGTGQVRLDQAASHLAFAYAPPVNAWTHLAVVAQSSGTQLYVNGVLTQTLGAFVLGSSAGAPVSLGASQNGTDDWFSGALDDVRIYTRALSASEIQVDMNTPVSGTPPPPDTTPPTVAITTPGAGATVSGTTTVTATASDNVGVVGVQFLLDSVNLGSEDTTAPYSIAWDTTTATNGTHSLAAVAHDAAGNRTTSAPVTVTISNLPQSLPVANFSATPISGPAPLPVTLTNTSTGSISMWAWSFGDGTNSTSSTGQNQQHTYSTAGSYTVSLTVTGPGGSATKTASITVTVPPPVANFSATPTTGPAPLLVTFTDASTGSMSTYAWNFGDGTSSTTQNPQHTYSKVGSYTVSLTVTGPGGTNTATKTNLITMTTPPPGSGLVAAYGFSEGTGPTTADASGHAYVGSLMNGVAWAPGKYGTGLSFDGANAYVALPASLDLPTLPVTLEAWVKPTNYNSYRTLFSKRSSYAATAMRLDWLLDSGTGRVRLDQAASHLTFTYAPPLNTWTHLAVVAQSTGTQLYVNGVLTQTLGVFTLGSSATAPVSLGASQQGTDDWFKGGLDEVRIYTRVLNAADIQADMQTPVDGMRLVAAYGFSEGTGPTTADASGHAYVGSLMNGVAWAPGKYGTGLSFDGTNAYVALPASLDLPTLPVTLEAWVKPTNYNSYRTLFSKRSSYAATAMRLDWLLDITSGRVRLDQAASHLTFTYAPPLNTWTHLTVVAQSTGTQLYVNGVLTQTLGVFTLGSSATAPVSLGAAQKGTDEWFKGGLDEVRIYTRVLNAAEIQADMSTPIK